MSRIILDDGNGAPVIDLEVVRYERQEHAEKLRCKHTRVFVHERKNTVTCRDCAAEVSAVWYLSMLVDEWMRLESRKKSAEAAVAQAEKRCRTKCEHCKQMTRIRNLW